LQRSAAVPKRYEQKRDDEGKEEEFQQQMEKTSIEITPIPKLVTESRIDTVGTVGGLRVYIPSRLARDSQFPLSAGEAVEIKAVKDRKGSVSGILITKK
jgi:hypothetical protein